MSVTVLSPTAILGYGFPEISFEEGLGHNPDFIAVDAGSTDPGPYYLGEGVSFTDRIAVERDLRLILDAGGRMGIPVAVGTAGGCGADAHLDWTLEIAREIARKDHLHFKLGIIRSEVPKDLVMRKLGEGHVSPLGPVGQLTERDVSDATAIVAQIGVEPFMECFNSGARVVTAGRSYDPAVFACLPIMKGEDKAMSLHMGKILECAAIAATPGSGSDCMLGTISGDAFSVRPLSESRVCTVTSVAAHTLYEKSDPYMLPGPGGHLDLRATGFEQTDERTVRVRGTKYVPSDGVYVKLEGARKVGYRTVSIAGSRDPVFIRSVDSILKGTEARTEDNFKAAKRGADYRLRFVVYGKNGVMGDLEPLTETSSHELGIVIEAVAKTQELANAICSFARSTLLHFGYPGRKSTAGNLALLYSPSDIKMGPVYEFCIHHLMRIDGYDEVCRIDFEEVAGK